MVIIAVLDLAKHLADVTLASSAPTAELAKSLEAEGYTPKAVAGFLVRILLCMFAEQVVLLPDWLFTELLQWVADDVERCRDPGAVRGVECGAGRTGGVGPHPQAPARIPESGWGGGAAGAAGGTGGKS